MKTDNIDFIKAFEGLPPDQAKELSDRIRSVVEETINDFMPDDEPGDDMNKLTQRWQAEARAKEQQAPGGRTREEIENDLQSASSQLQSMQRHPSRYRGQIETVRTRSDELWKEREQTIRVKASEAQAAKAPKIAELDASLGPLVEEHNRLSKNPSQNRARLRELSKQIETTMNQLAELQR